jgi:glutathione synthase/RimK-type ligase-like ATP-grasp enzyme
MERIYSLTENAKQMRSGLKIVQNFIHNVRKFYNFYIYIIRYI